MTTQNAVVAPVAAVAVLVTDSGVDAAASWDIGYENGRTWADRVVVAGSGLIREVSVNMRIKTATRLLNEAIAADDDIMSRMWGGVRAGLQDSL